MESKWSPDGLQWTPSGLQVDCRKLSSNMTIFVESWWTPDGVHQIHQDYLESTWSMWSKVKYCFLGMWLGGAACIGKGCVCLLFLLPFNLSFCLLPPFHPSFLLFPLLLLSVFLSLSPSIISLTPFLFLVPALFSQICLLILVMSTARLRAVKPSSWANILASQSGKSAPGYNQFGSQISRLWAALSGWAVQI